MGNEKGIGFENGDAPANQGKVGDFYLLSIAIDTYDVNKTPQFRPLHNPVRDGNALKDCLCQYYTFENERYFSLYNEQATKAELENKMKQLMGRQTGMVGENDCLIVFFSGHGHFDEDTEKLYLILYDQKVDCSEIYSYFNSYTDRKRCRHFLLILDCCYSGAISLANPGIGSDEDFSRYVITSTNVDEKALDGTYGHHSPFTLSLLEALQAFKNTTANFLQSDLGKNLTPSTEGLQQVRYLPLPVNANGKGSFPFILKFQRPEPVKVYDKLLKINFKDQRRIISPSFDLETDRFNLITLKGESTKTHQFAFQVLYEEFRTSFPEGRIPTRDFIKFRFKIGSVQQGALDFWNGLNRSFNKMHNDETIEHIAGLLLDKNVVVFCHIDLSDEDQFVTIQHQIRQFTEEFHSIFSKSAHINTLHEGNTNSFFMFFQDTRTSTSNFDESLFISVGASRRFNVFITDPLEGIRPRDFNQWWHKEGKQLLVSSEQEFEISKFQQPFDFETFILQLTEEFKFSSQDRNYLFELLFDPKK